MLRTTLFPFLASVVFFACGGSVEKVPDSNGSTSPAPPPGGGAGSGATSGTTSGGSKTGATTGSGGQVTSGSGEAQCDGLPNCNPGWSEVKGCVPDSQCEKLTTCGVSIICQKVDETCEGPQPICDPGDEEVVASWACPQDAKCYTRSNACGFTIWCASK